MNPMMSDWQTPNAHKPVIVALDFANEADALAFVRQLNPDACRLKVGKELFTTTGRRLVEQLIHQGFDVFLDLKYHDIPNTVASACKVAAQMGVWMVDMHASGGERMMAAAAEAVANESHRPYLIGVTVLTSMDAQDWQALGYAVSIEEQVLRLAHLTQQSGLDGVVCSAQEASLLRQALGSTPLLVTPGIRLPNQAGQDDQRRIMTPEAALAAGASYLVMGRPITQAAEPMAVLRAINDAMND